MHAKTALAIVVIAASVIVAMSPMVSPALAGKSSGDNGLNTADDNIHDNTPGEFAGPQDIRHHEGTCQGGHEVHIPDGCDNALITDPGNSDTHRKDK